MSDDNTIEVVIKNTTYVYALNQPWGTVVSWMAAYIDNPFGRGRRSICVDYVSFVLNLKAFGGSENAECDEDYMVLDHYPSYYLTLWNGKKITVKKVIRERDSFLDLRDSGDFMRLIEAAEAEGDYGEVSQIRKNKPLPVYHHDLSPYPPVNSKELASKYLTRSEFKRIKQQGRWPGDVKSIIRANT